MKWPTKKDRRSDLQKELDRVHAGMELCEPNSDEYKHLLETYQRLEEMRMKRKSRFPSADVAIQAGVTVGSILAILHHERLHVIASKAIGFVPKMIRRG